MHTIEEARKQLRDKSIYWGFRWAFCCAILWGAWYVPGTAIWFEAPYISMAFEAQSELLTAAAIITMFNAVTVLFFLLVWIAVLGKLGEYRRTFRQIKKLSKWYFLAAIFGGPCAIFGSYLAIAYIGGVFAAVSALLFPIVGATLARLWYKENITARATLGIFVLIAGGISVFAPGIMTEINSGGSGSGIWLGYIGGAMAAIGWGVEGAIAGRALDVSDADVGITVRFTAEVIYWCALIIPAIYFFSDAPVLQIIAGTFNFWAITWLLLAGITFGYCYVAWYKSFPLIGVGRGQAVATMSGVFTVFFLTIFTLDFPEWNFLLGLILAVTGGFIMFGESKDEMEVVRNIDNSIQTSAEGRLVLQGGIIMAKTHMKGFILQLLDKQAMWDYEIAGAIENEYGFSGRYWHGEIRATLTDLFSGALIEELQSALDDGSYFGAGKVLLKFNLTPFGKQRMRETGLA